MIAVSWEYTVKPEKLDEFLSHYEPGGTWVELFARSPGFLRTELLRDIANPLRFVTIDYWISETHREQFLAQFRSEYTHLDDLCRAFTNHEACLGLFTILD
jgi:quinol monooxygenase YgiN